MIDLFYRSKFSNFLSPQNKLRKELYRNNLEILEVQKLSSKPECKSKGKLSELIISYELQKNIFMKYFVIEVNICKITKICIKMESVQN